MAWTTPITDRTAADITYAKNNRGNAGFNKGAYNPYYDFNRIEQNCEHLSGLLNTYGYPVSITVKTDWTENDFPLQSEVDRIRDNIIALVDAYRTIPGNPEILYHDYLDLTDMNSLELNLKSLNAMLQDMIAGFHYCGIFYCGAFNI